MTTVLNTRPEVIRSQYYIEFAQ